MYEEMLPSSSSTCRLHGKQNPDLPISLNKGYGRSGTRVGARSSNKSEKLIFMGIRLRSIVPAVGGVHIWHVLWQF